jgi:hypothetical protein
MLASVPLPLCAGAIDDVVNPRSYNLRQAAAVAEAIVDLSGTGEILQSALTWTTGARRELSWRTALHIFCTAGILGGEMHVTRVSGVAQGMVDEGLLTASVSYCQLWDALDIFTKALESGSITTPHDHRVKVNTRTGEVADCPRGCRGGRTVTREVFSALLLLASAFPPGTSCMTLAFALDSTDLETWARRQSWDRRPDIDETSGAMHPEDEGETVDSADTFRTLDWPRIGPDGRLQHTLDPDPRSGYRSGKNGRRKETFCGWDIHLLTQVPEFGAPTTLSLALAVATAPAGSDKAAAGMLAIDALIAAGVKVRELLADRGYTYLKAHRWARKLHDRGILPTFDLHTNQRRARPGPVPGTIVVDGALFTSALPKDLRSLPKFNQGMSAKEKAALTAKYDMRLPYAFAPYGGVDRLGRQRWRGPTWRHFLRCRSHPSSMGKARNRPTTTCKPAKVDEDGKIISTCGCGKTVTLGLDFFLRERQPLLFGATAQFASYSRRTAVEELNAEIRTHRDMRFHRGWCRVRGTPKTQALVTFGLVGLNVRMTRDWNLRRLQPDPWLVAVRLNTDPDYRRLLRNRKRVPRPRALHEQLPVPRYLRSRAARAELARAGQHPVPLVPRPTPPLQPG